MTARKKRKSVDKKDYNYADLAALGSKCYGLGPILLNTEIALSR